MKVEDAKNNPDVDDDVKNLMNSVFEFDTDHKMSIMIPVPEDAKQEVEEAVAAGEVFMKDGMVVMEQFDWKIEDGKPYYDSQAEGEVLGEKVSPWVELKETADGYEIMSFRIVRV